MKLTEKSAYIKGLAEGLGIDKNTAEGKIIDALLDLVGELAEAVSEIDTQVDDLSEYVDELDEDLGDLEEYVYDDDDEYDDDEYDDDYECDGNCIECEEVDCPENDMRSALCPKCGEQIFYDESIDPENLVCPACGKAFSEPEEE